MIRTQEVPSRFQYFAFSHASLAALLAPSSQQGFLFWHPIRSKPVFQPTHPSISSSSDLHTPIQIQSTSARPARRPPPSQMINLSEESFKACPTSPLRAHAATYFNRQTASKLVVTGGLYQCVGILKPSWRNSIPIHPVLQTQKASPGRCATNTETSAVKHLRVRSRLRRDGSGVRSIYA